MGNEAGHIQYGSKIWGIVQYPVGSHFLSVSNYGYIKKRNENVIFLSIYVYWNFHFVCNIFSNSYEVVKTWTLFKFFESNFLTHRTVGVFLSWGFQKTVIVIERLRVLWSKKDWGYLHHIINHIYPIVCVCENLSSFSLFSRFIARWLQTKVSPEHGKFGKAIYGLHCPSVPGNTMCGQQILFQEKPAMTYSTRPSIQSMNFFVRYLFIKWFLSEMKSIQKKKS